MQTNPSGLIEYDDQITREIIERITVVDAHLIRIKFQDEDSEIEQAVC